MIYCEQIFLQVWWIVPGFGIQGGGFDGYDPLIVEIGKFFKSGLPPVSEAETLEVLAFMEAADESKRQGGKPVTLESIMKKALKIADKKWFPH